MNKGMFTALRDALVELLATQKAVLVELRRTNALLEAQAKPAPQPPAETVTTTKPKRTTRKKAGA